MKLEGAKAVRVLPVSRTAFEMPIGGPSGNPHLEGIKWLNAGVTRTELLRYRSYVVANQANIRPVKDG